MMISNKQPFGSLTEQVVCSQRSRQLVLFFLIGMAVFFPSVISADEHSSSGPPILTGDGGQIAGTAEQARPQRDGASNPGDSDQASRSAVQNSRRDQDVLNLEHPFLQQHCSECHTGNANEGGLAMESLGNNLEDPLTFQKWERLFDRVQAGTMPPADSEQPSPEKREQFIEALAAVLNKAHIATKETVLRRLNRQEYENTLNDLFGTNLDLQNLLPEDGRAGEFSNVGEALNISLIQLQRYLVAIDQVLDQSIAKTSTVPESIQKRANYAETREGEQHIGKLWKQLDDGAVVFFKAFGYPTGMLRTANAKQSGRYRIRVTGYAHQSEKPISFAIGATTFQRGLDHPTFAYRSLPPGPPTTVEITAWIEERYMVEITPWGITDTSQEIRKNGVDSYDGPGLAILHVDLEGPLNEEFPSRGHRLLFDGLNRTEVEPANPRAKEKYGYVPEFMIESGDPVHDAEMVLNRVATAAFRRPVERHQLQPFLDLFNTEWLAGASMEESLRTSVAAIFCSADFLYLREPSGWLDDYALAARLSYFLTRTTPDAELLRIAENGQLAGHPEVLRKQARRLLDTKHHERFVNDFTDAWLNLRDIDATAPDRKLYPEFDLYLKDSMIRETRQFFASLIANNESVTNLVDSDYAMLNDRLGKHYGIEGVLGPELRRVKLPDNSVRGGFLSQASVLKVTANGTTTSPVTRGAWVMERFSGYTSPPPPPGVPGVEPDIRGATTLRELLEKHRSMESCGVCHNKIDPPGFALEGFDPIGGYRTHFRSLGSGEPVDLKVNGRQVGYRTGPPVDASGETTDGSHFQGFQDYRELLVRDPSKLAATLTSKLLTFATGREMGFSDRATIDRIVDQSSAEGFRVRDLIEAIVSSETFRQK